jgi:hypothetical protein
LRAAIVGALVVVVVVVAAGVFVLQRGGESARGPLNEVLPARGDAAVAWAGDRLFVFGGFVRHDRDSGPGPVPLELLSDGALVDPVTSDAEALPPAPFGPPLYHPDAVTADRFVVVTGLSCGELRDYDGGDYECGASGRYKAASFNLDERTWRTVEPPPEAPFGFWMRLIGATSEGRALWQSGGFGYTTEPLAPPEFWTYRPATDEWAVLPDVGVVQDDVCVDDDRLVVLTSDFEHVGTVVDDDPRRVIRPGESVGGSMSDGYVLPSLRILDLAVDGSSWRAAVPDTDVKYDQDPTPQLVCMGRHALVVGFNELRVWDDDAANWSTLASPPARMAPGAPTVWTGDRLLTWSYGFGTDYSAQSFDPTTNEWRIEPTLADAIPSIEYPTPAPVWTGTDVVAYLPEPYDWSTTAWPAPRTASVVRWQPPP